LNLFKEKIWPENCARSDVKNWWHSALGTILAALVGAMWVVSGPALAGNGDGAAELALATRYENAEGVPRDYQRALNLYCDAWRQGSAEAAFNIGWMFLNARGVPRDDSVGVAWLRLGAKRGSAQAARVLDHLGDVKPARTEGCRGSVAGPRQVLAPKAIVALAEKVAAEYKVDPKLILAVIATESAFDIDAVSARNAQGLMQLIEQTAQRFGVRDVFEPADNIRGGTKYLKWLLARFNGDLSLALAAYYAGERAVERHGGVPQYAKSYLEKVLSHY
jgi:TPR repeat protein